MLWAFWVGAVLFAAEVIFGGARQALRRLRSTPISNSHTTPPGKYVVLYDGDCKFCQAQTQNLLYLARPGALHLVSFQEAGALAPFPGVSYEACMRAMHLITPEGRVYEGFAAIAHSLATRPGIGLLAYLYYLPGVHLLCELGYALVAANRYRIMGKKVAAGECDGACEVHLKRR